jgi:hypothetical protein
MMMNRILLVDDEAIREVFQEGLEKRGFEVVPAANVNEVMRLRPKNSMCYSLICECRKRATDLRWLAVMTIAAEVDSQLKQSLCVTCINRKRPSHKARPCLINGTWSTSNWATFTSFEDEPKHRLRAEND